MPGNTLSESCAICGQPARRLFETRGYEVWLCRACGFMRMLPVEAAAVDFAALYGDAYYGRSETAGPDAIQRYGLDGIAAAKMPQARAAVRLLQRFKPGGRLLDVGCSAGVFVKAASDAGFVAEGIDISPVGVEFARAQFGVKARAGTLESVDFGANRFEVITLWDVLEHFEDPWRAVRRVSELLAPDGVVALRTPNTRCLRTGLKGFRGWDMITPPEHFHLFARRSLALFWREFGFRLVACGTVHSHWMYYRGGSALSKLPFRLSGALGLGGDLVAVAERIT